MTDRLFTALLKYWRGRRGLSQLDLAVAADISARHMSFMESGRAHPSQEMVLRLMAALDVPLRDQNQVLHAAGYPARFTEPELHAIAPAVELAITRMMQQQEPFPLTVLTPDYNIIRANKAAHALFARFIAEPAHLPSPLNIFSILFDPRLARPFVKDWEQVAHRLIARLHREALQQREDTRLWSLLERTLAYPEVPDAWRQPDFSSPCESTLSIMLQRDKLRLGFLTTMTVFNAPQEVTLDELRIESYFPLDEATRALCEESAGA